MFGQNKKKTDSKIRFQNPRFRKQLQSAREYKRTKRTLPQTNGEVFLAKIGLGSWLSRFVTGLVFLLLIYLVFIPNFFFVKQTIINGSDSTGLPTAENLVASFLNKNTPWPQKNLLLLSKTKLKNFLLQNDRQIVSVDQISKKFPSTLTVSITPRVDQFSVLTASSTAYSVSNDGLVTGELLPEPSGTLPTLPFLIKLTQSGTLNLRQNFFSGDEAGFIKTLNAQLPGIIKSPIGHYEMTDPQTEYLNVFMQDGLELKFDFTSDLGQTLSRLTLLLSQFLPGDVKNLYYVDMRFEDRAYVCYQNTACASPTVIPNVPATTTPDSVGD